MDKIFKKRKQLQSNQNIKYLRYVFNDHFVLFLMIMLGALVVQYAQFLKTGHLDLVGKIVLVALISLLSQPIGQVSTGVEAADKVFLLAKENWLKGYLQRAWLNSLYLPALISALLVGIAAPLLKFDILWLLVWWLVLVGIKSLRLGLKLREFSKIGLLDWEKLIAYEENRKTSILRLFALFTNVKGIKSHSHRRKYLDGLLPKTKNTFEYLFARTYLRTGDYLGLTLRLLALALVVILFVKSSLFVVILVSVFNYLLLFQLLSLKNSHDYQPLLRIYPLKKTKKNTAVQAVLFRVFTIVTAIELLLAVILLTDKWSVVYILAINFVLLKFYIPWRIRK